MVKSECIAKAAKAARNAGNYPEIDAADSFDNGRWPSGSRLSLPSIPWDSCPTTRVEYLRKPSKRGKGGNTTACFRPSATIGDFVWFQARAVDGRDAPAWPVLHIQETDP